MCHTVTKTPLVQMPAYVKIPVIGVYMFIVLFGLGYCNVAFNLLTFQRYNRVGNSFVLGYLFGVGAAEQGLFVHTNGLIYTRVELSV